MAHSHHDHDGHDHGHSGHDHAHHDERQPEFAITLSAGHLQDLARLSVTWGQIEFLITNIVAALEKGDAHKTTVRLAAMTLDARVAHLSGLVPGVADDEARQRAADACAELAALVPGCNHALHGLWGDFIDYPGEKAVAACFYGLSTTGPVFAADLSRMAREAASLSCRLGALLSALSPAFAPMSPRRFFFSDRPPPQGPLPDWHP